MTSTAPQSKNAAEATTASNDNDVISQFKKTTLSIALGLGAAAYIQMLLFFGGAFAGAGHGTFFFAAVASGPFGLFVVLWPLTAILLPWRYLKLINFTVVLLSLIPIFWPLVFYWKLDSNELSYVRKTVHAAFDFLLIFWALYLLPPLYTLVSSGRNLFRKSKTPS